MKSNHLIDLPIALCIPQWVASTSTRFYEWQIPHADTNRYICIHEILVYISASTMYIKHLHYAHNRQNKKSQRKNVEKVRKKSNSYIFIVPRRRASCTQNDSAATCLSWGGYRAVSRRRGKWRGAKFHCWCLYTYMSTLGSVCVCV